LEPESFSFLAELIAGFESEAGDLVESITQSLLQVEKGGDGPGLSKLYEKICRSLHTLKGSAATCGLTEVSELSHRLEDVVMPLKSSGAALDPEAVDLLLGGLDMLLNRVRLHVREKNPAPPDPAEWNAFLGQLESTRQANAAKAPLAPEEKKETTHSPEEETVESLDLESGWKVNTQQVIHMMQEVERLRELKLRWSDQSRRLRQRLGDQKFKAELAGTGDLEAFLYSMSHDLVFNAEEVSNLVDSLEEHLKDISMLSFNTITQPLHRQVRDLCRRFGKQAELSVAGGEVLLDRRVLEGLKGPLVHLVRNALDHGLETPEQRDAAGKHREGSLVIRVEQQGNLLFLEVSDDGHGVDLEKIRQQALRRQMFSKEELSLMGEGQLRQLLFHSGFSTKEEVTNISGRGVGLDVVKSQIDAMKGTVEIQSKAGQGTRFIITLPVELGSSPVQIIRLGAHFFGLPLLSIQNIVRAHPEAMELSRDRWTLEYEGQSVLLKDLGALLRIRLPKKPVPGQPLLLLMASEGRALALAVDEIMGDENLVLHPLPPEFANVEAFQGAGLMPSGELMLILKSGWLGRLEERRDPFQDRLKALVVDDSLTARAMHRNMLESGGYLVHGASSARQGLELLETSSYDVILCDIGMEEMDGLAFTRLVRAEPKTRNLPIILVSARDGEKNVQGYLSAGANAFLSKKDCNSGRLLSEVAKVLGSKGKKP
jgi:two-component system chemotaxis sensor kinase CheA